MKTVIELLHRGAAEHGDMAYLGGKVGYEWKTCSFKETDRLSAIFASALISLGFKDRDNIAILSEGRPQWVICEYGVLKADCVSVPLSTKLTEGEIIFRLDHSESKALLVSENNYQKAVDALKETSVAPKVIVISPRTPALADIMAKNPLPGGAQPLFYDDLMDDAERAFGAHEARIAEIEKNLGADDVVTISYTSGTSGNPKGIMLTHRNYLHNTENALKTVTIKKGWTSLIMLPLDHAFAHTVGLYIFLRRGLTMYFVDSQGGAMATLRNLPINLKELKPDFLIIVPALAGNFMKKMSHGVSEKGGLVQKLFEAGVKAGARRIGDGFNKPPLGTRLANFLPWALANAIIFPKLRAVFGGRMLFAIGGGAMMETKQQEFFAAIGAPIYPGYGLTENAPIVCSNSHERHKYGTAGAIIADTEVRIMKDAATECARGEQGEIVVRGGSVMKGYYKNPQATAEAIVDGWLWTGDLGNIDSDGFLSVSGRAKALLIAPDGEKFSPEVIEEAICSTSKFVNQIMVYNDHCKFTCAVMTVNVPELKAAVQALGLLLSFDDDLDKIIALLREDVFAYAKKPEYAANIPSQWRPASFAVVPGVFDENNGFLNATLKMVRHKVREAFQPRIDELYQGGSADPMLPGNRKALREILRG